MTEPASAFQQYFAGVDDDGRSTVIAADTPPQLRAGGKLTVTSMWALAAGARPLTPGAAIDVPALDVGVGPGASRALVSSFVQGYDSGMHRTDTVDLSVVLAGPVDFHVESGVVTLNSGDCVMVPGVLHRWHARDAACTLAVVMIGCQAAQR